jgi:acylphosphatase
MRPSGMTAAGSIVDAAGARVPARHPRAPVGRGAVAFPLDTPGARGRILLGIAMHCLHLVIRGRVQGVGFRYFVVHRAATLGLGGWVRNRQDGAVEVEAEGPRVALEALLAAVRRGPTGARVTAVDEAWSERAPRHHGFEVGG